MYCPVNTKTKIMATIGPSSWDDTILRGMFDNGMSLARINASFADFNELQRVSTQLRAISPRIPIILDTQGNKIRIKNLSSPTLIEDTVILSSETVSKEVINVTYPNLHQYVTVGSEIMLDDGNIRLKVSSIIGSDIHCDVVQGGLLKPNKTVNIPNANLPFPILTEKDKADIQFAVQHNFDFVCASFVKTANDVLSVKNLLRNSNVGIISKIENREGVKNFDDIMKESDAIMIARGDLGVEMNFEVVPILQKQFIYKCRMAGKPVIVATQMLESMTSNTNPTRAEVSDVANAVMDGADCLMLSAETSTGKYPLESVIAMHKSILASELVMRPTPINGNTDAGIDTDQIALSLFSISQKLPIKAVIVISDNQSTVGSISRHRFNIPIYVVSSHLSSIRKNDLYNAVKTCYIPNLSSDRDNAVKDAVEHIYALGEFNFSDKVAIISGSSIKNRKEDSILEITVVKDILQ